MSIRLEHINYLYDEDTTIPVKALNDINLEIPNGQFVGVIGHTGSGKSTLVQHMNGLIKASSGVVYFNEQNIYDKDYNLKELRKDKTTILIAHRITTVKKLDKIIVMDDGKVVGYGTHEELLESCKMYKDIYKTQMGEYVHG